MKKMRATALVFLFVFPVHNVLTCIVNQERSLFCFVSRDATLRGGKKGNIKINDNAMSARQVINRLTTTDKQQRTKNTFIYCRKNSAVRVSHIQCTASTQKADVQTPNRRERRTRHSVQLVSPGYNSPAEPAALRPIG